MKEATKITLKGTALILSVLIGMLSIIYGMTAYDNRDKFKVSDCVIQIYEDEFKRSVYYHKILKVGKKMYLTNQKAANGEYYFLVKNSELKFDLNQYETVDKSLCVAKTHK